MPLSSEFISNGTCLNGREGIDRKVFMSFNNVDSALYPEQAWKISRTDLRNDGNADNIDGSYRATAHVYRGEGIEKEVLEGYLTFAARVHHDNNVGRSAYGVFIKKRNGTATSISFAVTQSATICEGQVIGTWRFSEDGEFCPSGALSFDYPESSSMFEIGLKRFDIVTQELLPFTLLNALARLFETPISRYSCPVDGASEMRMRYSIMDLYFTYLLGRVVRLRVGNKNDTTILEKKTSIVTVVAMVAILVYSFTSALFFWAVSRKNKIVSDFDDPIKLLTVWLKGFTPKYEVEEMSKSIRIRLVPDIDKTDVETSKTVD